MPKGYELEPYIATRVNQLKVAIHAKNKNTQSKAKIHMQIENPIKAKQIHVQIELLSLNKHQTK
jgi:hypothetical protein